MKDIDLKLAISKGIANNESVINDISMALAILPTGSVSFLEYYLVHSSKINTIKVSICFKVIPSLVPLFLNPHKYADAVKTGKSEIINQFGGLEEKNRHTVGVSIFSFSEIPNGEKKVTSQFLLLTIESIRVFHSKIKNLNSEDFDPKILIGNMIVEEYSSRSINDTSPIPTPLIQSRHSDPYISILKKFIAGK